MLGLFALAAALPLALADVFPTAPVAATKWTAGKAQPVTWQDDNKAPLLANISSLSIGLYTGSQQQQTLLAVLDPNVRASALKSSVTVDPTVGESGPYYFLRFHKAGTDLTDDIYTGRFAITGMTGTFNATVKAQLAGINGASSSASGASSAASSSSSSTASSTNAPIAAAASSGSSSLPTSAASNTGSSASASATSSTSGAGQVAALGGLLGASLLLLVYLLL